MPILITITISTHMKINKRWLKLVIKNNTELSKEERQELLTLSLRDNGVIRDYLRFSNKNSKYVFVAYLKYQNKIIASSVIRYAQGYLGEPRSVEVNFYTRAKYRKQGLCKYLSYVVYNVFNSTGRREKVRNLLYTHTGYSRSQYIGIINLHKCPPKGFRPLNKTKYKNFTISVHDVNRQNTNVLKKLRCGV